jgi:DNA repair exonuclease SbcCD nuclease subunit
MHFGVKAGNNDFLAFQIYWLEEALKKIQAMGITTIIQTGDMFDTRQHIKLNVLHFFINEFSPLLKKYGIERWYTYGGNHEMFYRDSNEICSLNLLMLLNDDHIMFDAAIDCNHFFRQGGKTIVLMPWINKNNKTRLFEELAGLKADYVFGHFEMAGMPMIPGVLCEHGIDPKEFKKFKRVISGHFHTVSQHTNVTMVGTPYHITWGDVQDGNNRGFWTLDLDTDELELHKNEDHMTLFSVIEYDPAEKYDAKSLEAYKGTIAKILVKEKPEVKHYKKFVDLLTKAEMIDYKIIDTTMVEVEKVEISEGVLALDTLSAMNAYIDKQGEEINKDRLKELAKSVYMEVLSGGQ